MVLYLIGEVLELDFANDLLLTIDSRFKKISSIYYLCVDKRYLIPVVPMRNQQVQSSFTV